VINSHFFIVFLCVIMGLAFSKFWSRMFGKKGDAYFDGWIGCRR